MNSQRKDVKAVAFDLYDTLVYRDQKAYSNAKRQMARLAGVDYDLFRQAWGRLTSESNMGISINKTSDRVRRILEELKAQKDEPTIMTIAEKEHEVLRNHVHLFDDVPPFLQLLRNSTYKVALISNCSRSVEEVLQSPNLEIDSRPFSQFFDTVILSYIVNMRKPDTGIYMKALNEMGVLPAECLFIGDGNDNELFGAHEAGMTTFQIQRPEHHYSPNTTVDRDSVNYMIEELDELRVFLPELN